MEECEFKEAEYQALIKQMLIDDFEKNTPFEIIYHEGANERSRGYDIEVLSLIPLFLQLKVPDFFYPMFSKSPLSTSRRDILNFTDNPGHFSFHLHLDKKTKTYMQHNLLCQLRKSGCYSRYVAPLFYLRDTLHNYSYHRPQLRWEIFHRFMMDRDEYYEWRDYLMFPDSITISPNEEI